MVLLPFEDLTVPLSGFYGIDRAKFSLKTTRPNFSKPTYHLSLMISHISIQNGHLYLSS